MGHELPLQGISVNYLDIATMFSLSTRHMMKLGQVSASPSFFFFFIGPLGATFSGLIMTYTCMAEVDA